MKRYIEISEIISFLKNYERFEIVQDLINRIADLPTIDMVHCKECKFFMDNVAEDSTDDECKWRTDESPNIDDFCSYGERIEE